MKQRTIEGRFSLSGIGLHSGRPAEIAVCPADENTGIIINGLPALSSEVKETRRGTTLGKVAVVEHFLAATYGLGIDNLAVEVVGEEFPALDGSALPFVRALTEAKIVDQAKEKNCLHLNQPIQVVDGECRLEAFPFDGFSLDFMIDFPVVGSQKLAFDFAAGSFEKELAPARTFGYMSELEALKKAGLGLGATLENALAIGPDGYLNQPRFPDELVRHKLLDLVGDLALLGRPLKARIVAKMTGHRHNIELVRRILNHG